MHASRLLLALGLAAASAYAAPPAMPAMPAHAMVDAATLKWGDGPPFLPPGVQFAVVSGDPSKAGPFVIRLKMPADYRVPRHWHPADEHVTVLEGSVEFDMGEGAGRHNATLDAGDYVLMPAKMQHEAHALSASVVQVHGIGPFAITYVDPAMDPRNAGKNAGK